MEVSTLLLKRINESKYITLSKKKKNSTLLLVLVLVQPAIAF